MNLRTVAKIPKAPKKTAPAVASPWAVAPDREQQREAKRNAVLQAAAQLFNERGFHATKGERDAVELQQGGGGRATGLFCLHRALLRVCSNL